MGLDCFAAKNQSRVHNNKVSGLNMATSFLEKEPNRIIC